MKIYGFRLKFHWNLFLGGPISSILALVQITAWRRPGDKPLSEPMMVSLLTHMWIIRPQWVKEILLGVNTPMFYLFSPVVALPQRMNAYCVLFSFFSINPFTLTTPELQICNNTITLPTTAVWREASFVTLHMRAVFHWKGDTIFFFSVNSLCILSRIFP